MFDRDTSERLTALLAGRILSHRTLVRQALATGNRDQIDQAIQHAASASAEVSTLALIIGTLGPFNAALASLGLPPVPDLSGEATTDAEALVREARANDVAFVQLRDMLTRHLN